MQKSIYLGIKSPNHQQTPIRPKQKARPGLAPGRSCIFPRWLALQGPEFGGTQGLDPTVRYDRVHHGPAQHGTVRFGAVHLPKDGTCHTYIHRTYILPTYISSPIR